MLLCKNARSHCWVTDKALYLFRGKMPESVNFLSLENARGNIVSNCSVSQTCEQYKMID